MSDLKDFIVYNIPAMLSRRVTKQDHADPGVWVLDEDWYARVRKKMQVLFSFYINHDLLVNAQAVGEVEKAVIRLSDFSKRGQRFIQSGASDRWLASFDRVGSTKDVNDVQYLEKQLSELEKS